MQRCATSASRRCAAPVREPVLPAGYEGVAENCLAECLPSGICQHAGVCGTIEAADDDCVIRRCTPTNADATSTAPKTSTVCQKAWLATHGRPVDRNARRSAAIPCAHRGRR